MGTLDKPGKFDCLSTLKRDEPFFVLKGSDTLGAPLVRLWAAAREGKTDGKEWYNAITSLIAAAKAKGPADENKITEASIVALQMHCYACGANGGHDRVDTGNPREKAKGLRRGYCGKCGMDMTEDSSD